MDNLTLITPVLAQQISQSILKREEHNLEVEKQVNELVIWFIKHYDLGDETDKKLWKKVYYRIRWNTGTWAFEKTLQRADSDSTLMNYSLINIIQLYEMTKPAPCYVDLGNERHRINPKRDYSEVMFDFRPIKENWYLTGFWGKRIKAWWRNR